MRHILTLVCWIILIFTLIKTIDGAGTSAKDTASGNHDKPEFPRLG
uniref:Salivary secreted peptide n=1 Tax=Anopheles stephensi TaxID=30069 RepID=A0A182YM65_ANOST